MPQETIQVDDENKPGANKKNEMADAVNNQRDELKKIAQKIFHQFKKGCNKDLCFKAWKEKKTLKQMLVEVKDSHSEYNATHESNKLKN